MSKKKSSIQFNKEVKELFTWSKNICYVKFNFKQLIGLPESVQRYCKYVLNLLPGERLKWMEIDSHTTKVTFNYNERSLFFIITFNELGDIIQIKTKRYLDTTTVETRGIKPADYKEAEMF